jgi:hypothetical protein
MRLLSEVNAISDTRGSLSSRSCFTMPAFAAATTSDPSVGSPFTIHCSSFSTKCASEESVAARRSSRKTGDGVVDLPLVWKSPCGL